MVYSALNITVPTWQDQRVTWRPGNKTWPFWLTSLKTGVIHRSCLASDVGQQVTFSSACWDSYQGQWRSRGYTEWDLNVRVALVWPCTLHKAYLSFSLSISLPLLCPLTQHTQTHSHRLLPFNSQLGIRKLERWGELHKENTNVKKTGTCTAISCHQNLL